MTKCLSWMLLTLFNALSRLAVCMQNEQLIPASFPFHAQSTCVVSVLPRSTVDGLGASMVCANRGGCLCHPIATMTVLADSLLVLTNSANLAQRTLTNFCYFFSVTFVSENVGIISPSQSAHVPLRCACDFKPIKEELFKDIK